MIRTLSRIEVLTTWSNFSLPILGLSSGVLSNFSPGVHRVSSISPLRSLKVRDLIHWRSNIRNSGMTRVSFPPITRIPSPKSASAVRNSTISMTSSWFRFCRELCKHLWGLKPGRKKNDPGDVNWSRQDFLGTWLTGTCQKRA
jgi:hypothetical protein